MSYPDLSNQPEGSVDDQATEPGPAAPADGQARLDSGTKVSGKLFFVGPAWIEGEVHGEILAG